MKTTTANPVTSEMSRSRTTFMVKLALMVAIIFVMAFSPLGYLRTPGLTITFLTVPVAVGAIILGPTAGAICGGAFGLTSAIMALPVVLLSAQLYYRSTHLVFYLLY